MSIAFRWVSGRRPAALLLAATMFSTPVFAGTVSGTVIDGSGTASMRDAEVEIVELGRVASTAIDGSYRFVEVPEGEYTVRVRYTGANELSERISVSANGLVQQNFRLSAGLTQDGSILVIGQRANLSSSISRQRAADGIETVLTRDAIGQFPDQNVAESLRRAAGVNVLNDQGEGRFVSIRGLDPNLNSTSINGNRVLATGGDERAAALDVIPSELIESIEIKKTLTPDMDGDTIGGSVEIHTTSAFSRQRGFINLNLEGSYNELRDRVSPKLGVDFSTRLGDNFGISGGATYNRRVFGSDNIEAPAWLTSDNGVLYPEELEFRDYDVVRERIGASLSFDARLGATTELYLRGLYSRFDDQELRRRLVLIFNEEPRAGTVNSASFDSRDGRIEIRRDLKDRQEIQEIQNYSFGGRTNTGPWRIVYDVSYSQARQFEDGSIDPLRFRRRFEARDALGVTIDYTNPQNPQYDITAGGTAFLDPSGYVPTVMERTTDENARDREWSLRTDITHSFSLDQGTFDIQGGVRARFRQKSLDFTYDAFDRFPKGMTLADFLGSQTYGLAGIDPVPGRDLWRAYYGANGVTGMTRNALDSDFMSAAEDYSARENILAGYIMGRYDTPSLRVIGGVRVERTSNTFHANRLTLNEDDETLAITPVRYNRDYTDWLPSLNIRYEPVDNVLLRIGAYRSLMRPKLSDIAPRFVIEENEDGDREGAFGNPDLMPYRAWNFDLSLEYYFARNAVVQLGYFHKSIDDFIVEANFDDGDAPYNGVYNGISFTEATIPLNGRRAIINGIEFSYQQALDFLPSPLDGFLVNFNYTFTDAKGQLADGAALGGRRIPLPASSRHTFNAALGYDKGPFSFRIAGTYRSRYLDEVAGNVEEDRYVDQHFQLDLTAKFRVTDHVRLVAEVVNLLDEPYYAYAGRNTRNHLLQYEEYGLTAKFGVRVDF